MFVCARRGVAPCPRYEVRLALFHQVDDVEHCFLCVLAGEEVRWSPWYARCWWWAFAVLR